MPQRTVALGKTCFNAEEFLDDGTGLPSATILYGVANPEKT